MTSLKNITAKVQKNPDMVAADLKQGLQEAMEKISGYKSSISTVAPNQHEVLVAICCRLDE